MSGVGWRVLVVGRRTTKHAPPSGAFSAVTLPWWASTTSRDDREAEPGAGLAALAAALRAPEALEQLLGRAAVGQAGTVVAHASR